MMNIDADLTSILECVEVAENISSKASLVIDWSQFVPEIIATFLGFGLALFGQWLWEYFKDKSSAKNLKKRITSELKKIKDDLSSITGIHVEPFKLSIWDTCISTGDLKVLDAELQDALSLVYSIIKEYNAWSLMQANYYFENGEINKVLDNELKRLGGILLGDTEKSIINIIGTLEGRYKSENTRI